jgi:pyridoxal phosphate enzyme (YggS family)
MSYLQNFITLKDQIYKLNPKINLVVVTKNQSLDLIGPIIKAGHVHFGENKVQEAKNKWEEIKKKETHLNLHLIGKLQSNKAKDAFEIFDFIHTLDNEKLAKIFSNLENNSEKKIKYFIQVNIGNEPQKSGIELSKLEPFIKYCKHDLKLNILGLMCIPPKDLDASVFFLNLKKENDKNLLQDLSMGMSSDYEDAIKFGATYLRIGSLIFKD